MIVRVRLSLSGIFRHSTLVRGGNELRDGGSRWTISTERQAEAAVWKFGRFGLQRSKTATL
eukprot:scaffold1377_cov198-Ochromonas_danica.AAC.1